MDSLTIKQKVIVIGAVVIVIILSYSFLQYKTKSDIVIKEQPTNEKVENSAKSETAEQETQKLKEIAVHICGSVKKPGVILLPEGSRVNDILKQVELEKGADINKLNLAMLLKDEDKIYVPKFGEKVADVNSQQTNQGEKVININTASSQELDEIPGVGPSTAEKIIQYRNTKGSFKKAEDLKNVSGIGEKKFESIKKYIKV